MTMERTDFERQINAVVPQPDPKTTAALFAFGQELGQEIDCDGAQDLLNSLHFISRHFSAEITQGAYEIIRYGAVLPGEMVAAALLMWNNFTPQQAAKLADEGYLMHFYWPKNKDESSPLAVCVIKEKDRRRTCHTMRFGQFDPEAALRAAQQYARDRKISVTDALLSLTVDMELKPDDAAEKILENETPETSDLLASTFFRCAAMAARLTFDADQNRVEVEYNPLWLGLRRQQEPVRGEMTQMM